MKILYDHQIFTTSQIYGDISRYFIELMKNFKNNNEMICSPLLDYHIQKITHGNT